MHVEKIKINQFRVLSDLDVTFQVPGGATADPETGNVVNVIAGVNGTGKTSLLEAIFMVANHKHGLPYGVGDVLDYEKDDSVFNLDYGVAQGAKTLLFPAKQSYKYKVSVDFKIDNFIYVNVESFLGDAELYIKEYIVSKERDVYDADPEKRKIEAINSFNNIFKEVSLQSTLVDLDHLRLNKPVFKGASGQLVNIDKLGDGEKLLFGRVMLLLAYNPVNSIILIDEPEIGLHPAWQQKIMQIYSRIGKNNQFIVATHSPQVIRSVPYQNRIILTKQEGKIQLIYFHQPPSGVDINSILSEVMGADPVPSQVIELYSKYRAFVEPGQEASPEAQSVKAQLLLEEGEHSSFMQEMNFLIELRDAA